MHTPIRYCLCVCPKSGFSTRSARAASQRCLLPVCPQPRGLVTLRKALLTHTLLNAHPCPLLPVCPQPGGLATLQKAIVLDSVGRSEEAQKLYKSIANHGVAQVGCCRAGGAG